MRKSETSPFLCSEITESLKIHNGTPSSNKAHINQKQNFNRSARDGSADSVKGLPMNKNSENSHDTSRYGFTILFLKKKKIFLFTMKLI